MTKAKKPEPKTPKPPKLTHGGYKILAQPPADIDLEPSVLDFRNRWTKRLEEIADSPELSTLGGIIIERFKRLVIMSLHEKKKAFEGEPIPLEFIALNSQLKTALRQDIRTFQSMHKTYQEERAKDFDSNPLKDLEAAEAELKAQELNSKKRSFKSKNPQK